MSLLLGSGTVSAHPSRGIVVTNDGHVYFSDLERLWMIDRSGQLLKLREQRDRHTHELAIDPAGNVVGEDSSYESGAYREAIWRVAPDRRFRFRYGPTMRVERGVGIIGDARGCTYHSNQTATTLHPLVHRRCPNGRIERLIGSAADDAGFKQELVSNVAGAALDRHGGFIFRQGIAIRRVTRDGSVNTLATGIARENFGIALSSDGSILVAEAAARRVLRIAPDGRRTLSAVSAKPWFPTGVASGSNALYVLEATDYVRGTLTRMRVRRISRGGASHTLAIITIPPA